ncbi:hypothetical protein BDP27DRAFT_1368582 [Rhodocollybia butyracea]|uniref:Uncharacterized protein n=1 Tax=Rhodocollybia butyracea TaxID=206335 RepID=A0A9P5U2K8_9AGAR|nr:hypothetical protein BDP27DRAFT_1368582 [Rhodocollybia butyracea]
MEGFTVGASNEAILEHQLSGWKSKAYDHFVLPPTIITINPLVIKYRFFCKRELPDLLPSTALAFLLLFDILKKALKADGEPTSIATASKMSSDEEEEVGEDVDVEENQQEEQEDGNWCEIKELCSKLTKVFANDKVVGRNTMKKACVSYF